MLDASMTQVETRLTNHDNSLNMLDGRVDTLDASMTQVETRLTNHDSSFNTLDGRVDTLDASMTQVETRLTNHDSSLNTLDGRVDTLDASMTQVETRLTNHDSSLNTINSNLNTFINRTDASFDRISARTPGSNIQIDSDVSFTTDVTIGGNLIIDGSFNFNEVIQNITTVNNELLISTQVDISNHGTGPALSVKQYGDGAGDKLAVFDATGSDGVAFEIMHDGDAVFYKDLSFAAFHDLSGKHYSLSGAFDGLSTSYNTFISRTDASFDNIQESTTNNGITFLSDVSFNHHVSFTDASFDSIAGVDGSLIVMSDLSVNGTIISKNGELGVDGKWTITNPASGQYKFEGTGIVDLSINPTLYLVRGSTYIFNNTVYNATHPLEIRDTAGTAYNKGVTNNGNSNGPIITFKVPQNAPDELKYQCTNHGNMIGVIKIVGSSAREASFNIIDEFTSGLGTTFLNDVSINTHLKVPDASFTRIGAIDNVRLIVTEDLSVNGNIFSTNFDDLSGKHYALDENFDDLSGKHYALDENFDDLSGKHYALDENFDDLSGKHYALDENFDDLSGKHYALDENFDDLSGKHYALDENFDDLSGKHYALDENFDDLSGKHYALDENFDDLSGKHYSLSGTVHGFNTSINTGTLNVNTIDENTGNNIQFDSDVSFLHNVHITGNLVLDGSLTETTVNTTAIESERIEVTNAGNNDALIINKTSGTGNVASFAGSDGSYVEIGPDSKTVFYKDVSINTHLSVPDASFTRIGAIDNNTLIVTDDLSVNGNILSTNFDDLSGKHYSLSGTVDGFQQSIATTDLSVNSISVKSGNIIQFSSEVSFNQHVSGTDASFSALSVSQLMGYSSIEVTHDLSLNQRLIAPDASFGRIGAIDGSLVVMGDLSVNGQIFFADGVVGGGGGSGTDASFDRIAEFTDGSGITFLNDVSINGNIFANNLSSSSVTNFTPFDLSSASDVSTNTTWTSSLPVTINANSLVFHNIKVSGYLTTGYIDWPMSGHEFIFQRRINGSASYTWDSSKDYEEVKYIFISQDNHEEVTYTILEKVPNTVTYDRWKCDISGDGARTDSTDKLTWEMTVVTPSDYLNPNSHFNALAIGASNAKNFNHTFDVSGTSNFIGHISANDASFGTIDASGDIRATGDITAFYTGTSDARLKTNICDIEDHENIIMNVRGVRFNWNETAQTIGSNVDLSKVEIGVIAQEIEEYIPEIIKDGLGNYKAVRYEKIVPILIEGMKDLYQKTARIPELEKRIAELEKNLSEMN